MEQYQTLCLPQKSVETRTLPVKEKSSIVKRDALVDGINEEESSNVLNEDHEEIFGAIDNRKVLPFKKLLREEQMKYTS